MIDTPIRIGPSAVPIEITVEVRGPTGEILRRIAIASYSPIPDSVAVSAALRKEFGSRVRFSV